MDMDFAQQTRPRPIAGRSSTLDSQHSYPRTHLHRSFTTQQQQPQHMFTPALFHGGDPHEQSGQGLDYETFLNLQEQFGVDSLRSNLNIAAAQTRSEHPSHPYHEPVYVFDAGAYGQAQAQSQWQDPQTYAPQQPQPSYHAQQYPSPFTNSQHSASVSPPIHNTMGVEYQPSPLPIHPALQRPQLSPIVTGPGPSRNHLAPQHESHQSDSRRPSRKRKRTQARQSRKRKGDDSGDDRDGDSNGSDADGRDEEDDGIGRGPDGQPVRLPGACKHCRKLKMKCEFEDPYDVVCKRCKTSRHECIVEGRRPRPPTTKREFLLAQIRHKDAIIDSLLKHIHSPNDHPIPAAHLSLHPSDDPSTFTNHLPPIPLQGGTTASTDQPDAAVLEWLEKAREAEGKYISDMTTSEEESESFDESDEEVGIRGRLWNRKGHGIGDYENFHNVPGEPSPIGLLAHLSIARTRSKSRSRTRTTRSSSVSADPSRTSHTNTHGRTDTPSTSALHADGSDSGGPADGNEDDNVGLANDTYFFPGPQSQLNLRAALLGQRPPEILVHGIVTPADVDQLFKIFYEKINPFVSLLDPVLHTPATTFNRCPFLFTVICAVSSRFYTSAPPSPPASNPLLPTTSSSNTNVTARQATRNRAAAQIKPEPAPVDQFSDKSKIYPIAMYFAKSAASKNLIEGLKSVELSQAYLLLSIYSMPARRWEEDRSWLYLGIAIRIATDLNLYRPSSAKPANETQERELLNRTRTWLICFNLDRSTSTQFGKPFTIKEDFIVRGANNWYRSNQYNHPYDIHLCAYSRLLRIVARFHGEVYSNPDHPTGLNKHIDLHGIAARYEQELNEFEDHTAIAFRESFNPSDLGSAFRCKLLPFLANYSRLVMFSFGFQRVFQMGELKAGDIFLQRCLSAASKVLTVMIDTLAPSGYMRYSPDGHFVFSAFAAAFLLKLLRPDFNEIIDDSGRNEIVQLVERLIAAIGSPEIAIDERHTPKLYARFLQGLLHKQLNPDPEPEFDITPMNGGALQASGSPLPIIGEIPPDGEVEPGTPSISVERSPPQPTRPLSGSYEAHDGHYQVGGRLSPVYDERQSTSASSTVNGGHDLDDGTERSIGGDIIHPHGVPDEDLLATMQILTNPAFFDHMLMPGFAPEEWLGDHPPPSDHQVHPALHLPPQSIQHQLQPQQQGAGGLGFPGQGMQGYPNQYQQMNYTNPGPVPGYQNGYATNYNYTG
ncbi:hypothetical protein SISSUDRAFT_1050554 [Sistotremastrum suecicum HHB10207 ss-3]|uniref:Zn(2)-C6 fungal-type domain-containing protein n=1 Tax=Sistotremastrum suecicum HHB10207 ss-3 TaxID=1314776 RepID=A0A166B3V3_9AGAM|nr:hypothetical protein SISSUDRAFT_1050554 [Sistotremastrum suecicum HHB10207 ss-3]